MSVQLSLGYLATKLGDLVTRLTAVDRRLGHCPTDGSSVPLDTAPRRATGRSMPSCRRSPDVRGPRTGSPHATHRPAAPDRAPGRSRGRSRTARLDRATARPREVCAPASGSRRTPSVAAWSPSKSAPAAARCAFTLSTTAVGLATPKARDQPEPADDRPEDESVSPGRGASSARTRRACRRSRASSPSRRTDPASTRTSARRGASPQSADPIIPNRRTISARESARRTRAWVGVWGCTAAKIATRRGIARAATAVSSKKPRRAYSAYVSPAVERTCSAPPKR